MARSTIGPARHARKKKLLKRAKGFRGGRSKLSRVAKHVVLYAERHATNDRRKRKGDYRRLWITRISAAVRMHEMSYSQFINALKKASIELDRKSLSELAINNPEAFAEIVNQAKAALNAA
jgi:large subunit ribosomal protein L20